MNDLRVACLHPTFSHPRVQACMSTRVGGVSAAPFESLNLRPGIGDEVQAVARNRARWAQALGRAPVGVDQVHGVAVARLNAAHAATVADGAAYVQAVADACFTVDAGVACEIQVADCLPVIFADQSGRVVGAAHAGWRGLVGGVLEATVAAMCQAADAAPASIEAWLGACIGPHAFEVGDEVRAAFISAAGAGSGATLAASRFQPGAAAGKWWADLAALARDRLQVAGVTQMSGNDSSTKWCTYSQPSRFFSYRRDGLTGRMAVAVWLEPEF